MKVIYLSILTLVLLACAPFKDPAFKSFDGFEMGKMDNGTISFTLKSTVENQNWFALKVKPSVLDVSIEGKKLGVLYLDSKLKMKAKQATLLEAPMHIELEKGAMMSLMTLALKDSVKLQLTGDVKGGVFFLYKKFPLDITRSVSPKSFNPMKSMNQFNKN